MRPLFAAFTLVVLAACGGSRGPTSAGPVPAHASGPELVEDFMQAVADSNLIRMGQLWGTRRGPAAVTGDPGDWQRRMVIAQAYLRDGAFRVSGNVAQGDGVRQITVDLDRGGCVRQVPFTVQRLSSGNWLIVNFDVSQAGNPARPCGEE